ncbi:MAG: long-chain-fatty-acid--CoA ligase [Maricaulaceae bacterium]|jgi:fatty-acyl-CoA synthase
MLGLMQDWPLTCDKILEHAKYKWPNRPVISRTIEGPIVESTYGEVYDRARKLSSTLHRKLKVKPGDRIATLAWNTHRHLEAWYAICGLGAIYHTLNPRLFPEQIAWIANHAEDRYLFTDLTFVPLLEQIQKQLKSVKGFIILTDREHMPQTSLKHVHCYEDLVAEGDGDVKWGGFDENTACGLCYTSGTTGDPKGVLYSHRSNVIHALVTSLDDALALNAGEVAMPIVPLFHANAWGHSFSAPLTGATLVFPGDKMDGASVYELLDKYKVTMSAGVPTVWLMLLEHLRANNLQVPHLNRVVIGGSAAPEAMIRTFEGDYGVEVVHAWGMTEMSPLGTVSRLPPNERNRPLEETIAYKLKQGPAAFTVEMRIVDDADKALPHDGKTYGRLQVRGPSIAKAYFKGAGGQVLDKEGWFDTGDVATIDEGGSMQIVDRTKDVVKSGGEWISTIDIENIAVGHPQLTETCVIGMPHPKWDERPVLFAVARDGAAPSKEEVLGFLEGKIAKWWTPDDVVFVAELPHTATGKLDKKALRAEYKDYVLPTAKAEA